MKLEYSGQVLEFFRTLAPEPRRALVRAAKQLPDGRGDIKPLQGELIGFWRLRVKGYRIVFRYGENTVRCEYAERRSIIYDLLAAELNRLNRL